MNKIIVGNWKMYPTFSDSMVLATTLQGELEKYRKIEVVLAPPLIWLVPIIDAWKTKHSHVSFASQVIWPDDQGAYTGDVSAYLLKDIVSYALVGHSEQRQNHGESNELVSRKVVSALKWGIKPIVCIGETKKIIDEHGNKNDSQWQKLVGQLKEALLDVNRHHFDSVLVAYEPVWAIGTQNPATSAYANRIINDLISELQVIFGSGVKDLRFLYGGSVGPDNVLSFLKEESIDGLLVGGASVKITDFLAICRIASSL